MSVTLPINSICTSNYSFLQTAGIFCSVNASNRLLQHSDGSIHLIEKTPAEVAGEKILRPLLDKISTLFSALTQYLPSFPSLPGASAIRIDPCSKTLHFPSETTIASCLERHPLVGKKIANMLIHEKAVIPAVAKFFANQDTDRAAVILGIDRIILNLHDRGKLLGLTYKEIEQLYALEACATSDSS